MTFDRSSYRSPRGRVSSFRDRGRGASSDSYNSSRESYSKSTFRGNSFQSSSYRGRDDRDSRGRGTHRYSGERNSNPSHSRKDEAPNFHRRETRETASTSYRREDSHSRRSDSESDRKRMRLDLAGFFKEGASRRSFTELDHPNRSLDYTSSSLDCGPFGGKSSKNDSDFKKPLPPLDLPRFSSRRSRFRTHINISVRPPSQLQLSLRKKKQIEISRLRKERETRERPSSEKPSYAEDKKTPKELCDYNKDVDLKDAKDERPGMSSPARTSVRTESGAAAEKSGLLSQSPILQGGAHLSFGRIRRIQLKCPHCKMECKMFRTYQAHLTTYQHKEAMGRLFLDLKKKLSNLRVDQRKEQRIIDERENNLNSTMYCKLCKLNYKQTRTDHETSDFHINIREFLNSRCKTCCMDFPTPLLYENHRCTLTHIKRKAFLKKLNAFDDRDEEEENEDENFMVLDSVGSADELNEDFDSSKENTDSPKKTLKVKNKPTIIGNEHIKKVGIYYCKLCKLCLHYNPNRDAEDVLLSHCRTRFHLKRFSLVDAEKKSEEKVSNEKSQSAPEKSANNTSIENIDRNDEKNVKMVDDEVVGNAQNSLGDDDDSNSGHRYNRFGTSDNKNVKIEPVDQPKKNTEIQKTVAE